MSKFFKKCSNVFSNVKSTVTHDKFLITTILFITGIIFLFLALKTEIASTILTIDLFQGLGYSEMKWFGIANDIVKCTGFSIGAFAFIKKERKKAILFISMGFICMVISFLASQATDLNISIKNENEAYMNSDEYKTYDNEYESYKNKEKIAIEDKEKINDDYIEKKKIEGTKDLLIEKNNLPSNYTTKKLNLQKQIEIKKSEIENNINKEKKLLEDNIKKYENKKEEYLNKKNNLKKTKNFTTEGINNLSNWMGLEIGTLGIGKNTHLEILGIVLFIIGTFCLRHSKNEFSKINKKDFSKMQDKAKNIMKNVEDFVKVDLRKKEAGITMLKTDNNISKDFIDKVFDEIKKSKYKNSNQVSGIRVIAKKLNLKIGDIQAVWNILKRNNKIEIKNKKTFLV